LQQKQATEHIEGILDAMEHRVAFICLARRRCDALPTMLPNKT